MTTLPELRQACQRTPVEVVVEENDAIQPYRLCGACARRLHLRSLRQIGQHGIRRQNGTVPVRYEAIQQGLARVAKEARALGASVHMPRIACGPAGGTWDRVEPSIQAELVEKGILVVNTFAKI